MDTQSQKLQDAIESRNIESLKDTLLNDFLRSYDPSMSKGATGSASQGQTTYLPVIQNCSPEAQRWLTEQAQQFGVHTS